MHFLSRLGLAALLVAPSVSSPLHKSHDRRVKGPILPNASIFLLPGETLPLNFDFPSIGEKIKANVERADIDANTAGKLKHVRRNNNQAQGKKPKDKNPKDKKPKEKKPKEKKPKDQVEHAEDNNGVTIFRDGQGNEFVTDRNGVVIGQYKDDQVVPLPQPKEDPQKQPEAPKSVEQLQEQMVPPPQHAPVDEPHRKESSSDSGDVKQLRADAHKWESSAKKLEPQLKELHNQMFDDKSLLPTVENLRYQHDRYLRKAEVFQNLADELARKDGEYEKTMKQLNGFGNFRKANM